jgi:hypothetical protein
MSRNACLPIVYGEVSIRFTRIEDLEKALLQAMTFMAVEMLGMMLQRVSLGALSIAPGSTTRTDGPASCLGAPDVTHEPYVAGPMAAPIVMPAMHVRIAPAPGVEAPHQVSS